MYYGIKHVHLSTFVMNKSRCVLLVTRTAEAREQCRKWVGYEMYYDIDNMYHITFIMNKSRRVLLSHHFNGRYQKWARY